MKLRAVLDAEGVPITDGEIDVLSRLRKLRNDVVHGRRTDTPRQEDVEYAISIVSRMLVYRVSHRAAVAPCPVAAASGA